MWENICDSFKYYGGRGEGGVLKLRKDSSEELSETTGIEIQGQH